MPDQVGWILRKLMTSTTVDTEYKLNEDKSTFTKVFGALNRNDATKHTFSARWPLIWRGRQNIQCPRKESSSQREAFQAKRRSAGQTSFGLFYLWPPSGGKASGDKWGKPCAGNEVTYLNQSESLLIIWRYADNGEIAAIIKHKVEDGKMSVILECGDIVCNSTYVKMWRKKVRSSHIVELWYFDCVSLFSDWGFLWNVWGRELQWEWKLAKEVQATRRELRTVCRNSWTGTWGRCCATHWEIFARCSCIWTTKIWCPCWPCANSGLQWLSDLSCGPSSGRWPPTSCETTIPASGSWSASTTSPKKSSPTCSAYTGGQLWL